MANKFLHEFDPWLPPLLPRTAIFLMEDTNGRLEFRFSLEQLLATVGTETYPAPAVAGTTVGSLAAGTSIGDLSAIELWQLALAEPTVYPFYQPARLELDQSAPEVGEVGEVLDNVLTSHFVQGDAGLLLSQEIRKGSAIVLGAPATVQYTQQTVQVRRTLLPQTFQAHASHGAGQPKLVQPAGTDDDRPARIGQPDAPQAANPDLVSNQVRVVGYYALLWGPVAAVPTTSPEARALAGYQLTAAGLQLTLETGTVRRRFVVLVPPGLQLAAVVDAETNADLLSQYAPSPFALEDAGGAVQNYTLYVMEQAVAYSSNHHHLLTLRA